jgi:hypothetical protein
MAWHEVVRTFANESEIGRGNKLLDPEVRPSRSSPAGASRSGRPPSPPSSSGDARAARFFIARRRTEE